MLRTLGGLGIVGSDFQRPKPLLLLAYLALEGAQERRVLRDLFWPGDENAAAHLRVTLGRLRQGLPDAVHVEGTRLRAAAPCDAQALLDAHDHARYDEVVRLHTGAFLAGVDLPDLGEELSEWLYGTRDILAARVRDAHLHLAEAQARHGEFRAAARQAETAYLLPGAPEPEPEDLRRLHALLLAGDSVHAPDVRREAAAYDLTLPVTPDDARALFTPTPPREPVTGPARVTPAPLPAATYFVGRERELDLLAERVQDLTCRCFTLTGLGGTGKTRLAIEAAHHAQAAHLFPDGVHFIELADLTSAAAVTARLVQTLTGTAEHAHPSAALHAQLQDARVLLVLDNAEHLPDLPPVIADLLRHTAHVRTLITSREPLGLHEEWVLPLSGLNVTPAHPHGTHLELPAAAQLFLSRARRANAAFTLPPDEWPAVLDLCDLTGGLPLAIELAASWARVLTPTEILAELQRSTDLLDDPASVTSHHRSMRAVFDQTWARLTDRERAVLTRLSVTEGGFSREAAARIARATLPDLVRLTDRTLLHLRHPGRYDFHPLIRQYVRLNAAEDVLNSARDEHRSYYLQVLRTHAGALSGARQREVLRQLEDEHANLHLAWLRACEARAFAEVRGAARELRNYFMCNGKLTEGIAWFEDARSRFHGAVEQATVFIYEAGLRMRRGALEDVRQRLDAALTVLREVTPEDEWTPYVGQLTRAMLLKRQNHLEAAAELFSALLPAAEAFEQLSDVALIHDYLAAIHRKRRDFPRAQDHALRAAEAFKALDNPDKISSSISNYALLLQDDGKYPEARAGFLEALSYADRHSNPSIKPQILNNLAYLSLCMKNAAEALKFCDEAIRLSDAIEDKTIIYYIMDTYARAKLLDGDIGNASKIFELNLKTAKKVDSVGLLLDCLTGLAEVELFRGNTAGAAEMLRAVVAHPGCSNNIRTAVSALVSSWALPVELNASAEGPSPLLMERLLSGALQERRLGLNPSLT
ncbi:AAA family ATPase [Deinococcus maricopensis]|uniref:ORC1/DEAH AAA+ ATPase domain-containing protein n=1 Tax=Deinococcus maricopensis (strain DSM 21211 / LMG 22137 / NRRL B-23946 / LB-34) TaxID=709986 RepID=E8U779_DEIML|nr:AAA family ATPase [Deinococcus maricopensis]ADV66918.1 hypothetical protein Deima_1267 [Deinococcus maricopensis DSM 21211]